MITEIPAAAADASSTATEDLVVQAQAGDARALEKLLRDWYPRLIRFAAGFLRNDDAAQDVVQESLCKVAQNLDRLETPAAFPSWVHTIVRRESVEFFRRERRAHQDGISLDDARLERELADSREPFEASPELEQCLERLRREDRELVNLHYWCGLELKEIALIFGIAAGAVKTRLFRVRAQLRELLYPTLSTSSS